MRRHDPIEIEGAICDTGDLPSRSIAAAVIRLAITDLTVDASDRRIRAGVGTNRDDVRTAIDFLFGQENACSGWAGMIDFEVSMLRRQIVASFRRTIEANLSGNGEALKRKKARIALARIEHFRRFGLLPPAEKASQPSTKKKKPAPLRVRKKVTA